MAGVRYHGYYSNVSQGRRKKAQADDRIPCMLEPELTSKLSVKIGRALSKRFMNM